MKLRVTVADVDGSVAMTRDIELDRFTSHLLGQNVNTQCCPVVTVELVHSELLAALKVPPGFRPGS